MCHNYFPPPDKPFVLNLASLNDEIREKSIDHIIKAIKFSEKIGSTKYGFHAGYFFNPPVNQLGKNMEAKHLENIDKSVGAFINGFHKVKNTSGTVELFIENNVLSEANYKEFGCIPFMLCTSNDYYKLKEQVNFNLLLDIAHLKVTSKTLGLNFESELFSLIQHADYVHISDNDGISDSNKPIERDSEMLQILKGIDFSKKIVTIEVYDEINNIINSYENLLNNILC
ncbi:MAG: xylose isomerase [Bacteroidales bacterium]|nr:xylose isomerase [Bacteroidales bacterium]